MSVVELLVECFIFVISELKAWNILQRYWQVVIIPRIVYQAKYLIGYSNLSENHEQPLRSLEDPFHVSVVGQPFSESKWSVKKLTLLSSQLRHDKSARNFCFDSIICPPQPFERSMGSDQRMATIAVYVGIQSDLTSCRRDLGNPTRSHVDKTDPCSTDGCTERQSRQRSGPWLGTLFV